MRILGIDPGVATIGFGVIDFSGREYKLVNCGVITTPAHTMLSARLEQIYDDMCQLLELFKPDAVSIEELFFNTNITTGIAVAHGRGVLLLACRKAGVAIYEYTPLQVKQAVVGWTWSGAYAPCRRRRSPTTRRTPWRLRCAMRAAPLHFCIRETGKNVLPHRGRCCGIAARPCSY